MSKQKIIIKYKCPQCGREGAYEPDENDLKQLNESGIASFSVFHGDHTLVVWFDKSGGVRAYDVFKATSEEAKAAPTELDWKKVNENKVKLENISVLFADRKDAIYSDLLYKGDPNILLRLIETVKEPKVIKIDTVQYYVYPLDSIYIAVGGNIPTKMLDKIIMLFRASIKYDVVHDEVVQYIIGSAIESSIVHNDVIMLINATDLLKHLDEFLLIEKKMISDLIDVGLSQLDSALLKELVNMESMALRDFIKNIMLKGNHSFFLLFLKYFADLVYMNLIRFTIKP